MLTDTNSFLIASSFCNIIARMSEENSDVYIIAGFEAEGLKAERVQIVRQGSVGPMAFMVTNGSHLYFFMRGIQTWSQGVAYVQGGLNPLLILPTPQTNVYCQLLANTLRAALAAFDSPAITTYHFAGHSLGGAVTEIVVQNYFGNDGSKIADFMTFGSPKPGNRYFATKSIFNQLVRWMTMGDVIPAAMPHAGDAPFAQQILGPTITAISDFNAQPPGGILLGPMGMNQAADGEHPNGGIYEADLVTWFNGGNGVLADPHQIQEYGSQIMAHILPMADVSSLKDKVIFEEGQPPLTTIAAFIDIEEGLKALSQPANLMGAAMVAIIPKLDQPIVIKMGSNHALKWMGFIISVHPTRVNAKIAKKHIVSALKRLQTSLEWNTPNLSNALANYLAAASSPVGGFRPIPAPL